MSVPLLDKPAFPPIEEKLVTLHGISWQQFKGIEAQLKDNRDVRLSYLSRILEIMSPIGEKHEEVKSTLSLLLDAYMKEKGIRFTNVVDTLWKHQAMLLGHQTSLTALVQKEKSLI